MSLLRLLLSVTAAFCAGSWTVLVLCLLALTLTDEITEAIMDASR